MSDRALRIVDKTVWFICTARNAIVVIACLIMAMCMDPEVGQIGRFEIIIGPCINSIIKIRSNSVNSDLLTMKLRLILARLRTGRVGIMFTIDLSQFLTPIFKLL